MWKKVVPRKAGRSFMAVALLLMIFTLFGCTTGTKKDPGLTDYEAPNIPQNITAVGRERACLINWSANTEADLVGYKVYRSASSGAVVFSFCSSTDSIPINLSIFILLTLHLYSTKYNMTTICHVYYNMYENFLKTKKGT